MALVFNVSFTIFSGTAPLVATTLIRDTGQLRVAGVPDDGERRCSRCVGSLWVERYGGNVMKAQS